MSSRKIVITHKVKDDESYLYDEDMNLLIKQESRYARCAIALSRVIIPMLDSGALDALSERQKMEISGEYGYGYLVCTLLDVGVKVERNDNYTQFTVTIP